MNDVKGEKQHYLAINMLYASFKEILSNHNKEFYWLNYLHLFSIEENQNLHENTSKIMNNVKK